MKEKVLIFVPYQDSDNFLSDGILTREFAMLYMLWNKGYRKVIDVKKPRTCLDKKRYTVNEDFYPNGTIEHVVRNLLRDAEHIQYVPIFSIQQIIHRRGWWKYGYQKNISTITIEENKEYLIYSNNPYASTLLSYLKERGCKIFFDIMDNFVIHPSLSEHERKIALEGYKDVFKFADLISANSQQTCDFMKQYTNKKINLVKNGVFVCNEIDTNTPLDVVSRIRKEKEYYKRSVGYIGKLGLRLDANLIDEVSRMNNDTLFVFVGGYLKGQINNKLIELFKNRKNILHVDAVPSAYVYPIIEEFDMLMIPHSVGKSENGGDPLKLYQYMTRKKAIITTPILGVDEFSDSIFISDNSDEWTDIILHSDGNEYNYNKWVDVISWESRTKSILDEIELGAIQNEIG